MEKLSGIINKYLASPAFYGLAEGTQGNYLRELKKIPPALLELEIKEIKRKELFAYFDKNGLGYHHKSVFQRIFSFAYDRGEIDFHPLLRLKKEKLKNPPRPWTEREISIALSSENTDFVFLVKLFIYTGQRRSDVIRIKWADVFLQENYIVLKQKKTEQHLRLPIHPSLRAALLKRSRKDSFVATRNGKPWEIYGVNYVIKRELNKLGIYERTSHGLRKSCAVFLREGGANIAEIKAITGHTSDAMVNHYAKEADQFLLASKIIDKLPTF